MSGTGATAPDPDRAVRLAAHPVRRLPPVGDPYVLGRWHHDRATWRGYAFEARVFLKSLIRQNDTRRFLILGRPRSGTTLLQRLLHQVEGIHCDGEVLHHAVLNPRGFLNRLAGIKTSRAWGGKLLSYQLLEVQRIADHRTFLEGLLEDGFRLVHIRRRTYDQSLSLSIAQVIGQYHVHTGREAGPMQTLSLDPDRFVAQLRWNLAILDYENQLLADLPHLVVDYSTDLENPGGHQHAVDRICAALDLPSGRVTADLARTAKTYSIDNLDAVQAATRKAGLGHVLDDPAT